MCSACEWETIASLAEEVCKMPWSGQTAVPGILQGVRSARHVSPRQRYTIEQYAILASEQMLLDLPTDRVPKGFDAANLPPPSPRVSRAKVADEIPARPRVLLCVAKIDQDSSRASEAHDLAAGWLPSSVNIAWPSDGWWKSLRNSEGGSWEKAYERSAAIFDGVLLLELENGMLARGQFSIAKAFFARGRRVGVVRRDGVHTVAAVIRPRDEYGQTTPDAEADWKAGYGKAVCQI